MEKVLSRNVTWIDAENPTNDEISALSKKHMIHPLVAQEILVTTYRPKVESYDEHLYLVLHFPIYDPRASSSLSREIDFVIFPFTLMTFHYDPIPQLDDFQELLATHEALRERTFGRSSGHLLFHIINQLFALSRKELDKIEAKAKEIEEKVFSGLEHQALREIAYMRRDILNFQKALKPQQAILDSLEVHGLAFFGHDMKPYLADIKGAYLQVWNAVENVREILDTLYETNLSLLSANTNEVTKIFTVIAAILLPVTLIASIYGMSIVGIPFANNPSIFWFILGVMALISYSIYRYFKNNKWI